MIISNLLQKHSIEAQVLCTEYVGLRILQTQFLYGTENLALKKYQGSNSQNADTSILR